MLIQSIMLIGFVLHFKAVSRGNIDLPASMPDKIFTDKARFFLFWLNYE
jgi:hypothetical protein